MAYNTKNVIMDLSNLKPVPQYFNPVADQYEAVQGADGLSKAVKSFVFQSAAIAAGNGQAFAHYAFGSMTVEITGTSTSFTVVFEAAGESGVFTPITAYDRGTNIPITQTTKTGLYAVDINGVASVRVRISAIGNGNLTIQGRAVS